MSTFPNSPLVHKGAIVGLDPFNPIASVVVFQYNPETITRTLAAQSSGAQSGSAPGAAAETQRLFGPPLENLRFDIVLDATDQLEQGAPVAVSLGVQPQLASLEMLLYPKSALVIANEVLLRAGVIEVIPPESPLTILMLGPKRVLPVRLTELAITEEMFDPELNPLLAKVTLGLRVLNYRDAGLLSPTGALFMAHQIVKETLATLNGAMASSLVSANFGV